MVMNEVRKVRIEIKVRNSFKLVVIIIVVNEFDFFGFRYWLRDFFLLDKGEDKER